MIDSNELFEVESHIRWGCIDSSRQMKLFKLLQSSPSLATDADEFGTTLLMIAADAANLEAVQHLCLLGSNSGALASTGDTPLICVVRGALDDPPGSRSTETRTAIIDTLVQYGANPNQLGWQGCSALHYAVMYGLTDAVHRLLLGGADSLVRLSDPPSDDNAIELAQSHRFRGSDQQRQAILALLTEKHV
jgi:ankyrin repeat protein